MTRGRPQEFDREDALERAMNLFWSCGYEATGMQALTEHMGISRQSLYNTFGDKQSLLLQAIEYYDKFLFKKWREMLLTPGSPLKGLKVLLQFMEVYATSKQFRGCLFANTTLELSHREHEVKELLKKKAVKSDRLIENTLKNAVQKGELVESVNTRALARFIMNNLRGLMVTAKGGATKTEIKDIISILQKHIEQFAV
ncbi:MAG: TetR/AcrR family transcriptional regulator [Nitrospinae bacterium]|nr:TetR/AcrR family transcriptional regulator [Nitrospinota bacterium]